MSGPVQPSDKLIDEIAKRVGYKALQKLDEALNQQPVSLEKLDTYANVVVAAAAAMTDPDMAPTEID